MNLQKILIFQKFMKVTKSWLKNNDFDAFVITVSVESTLEYLKNMTLKKPILVEKPVSTSSKLIYDVKSNSDHVQWLIIDDFIIVLLAKTFINSNNECFIKMNLPDKIDFDFWKTGIFWCHGKVVHGLDILNFLLPNLNLYDVEGHIQPNNTYGKIAYLKNNLNQSA